MGIPIGNSPPASRVIGAQSKAVVRDALANELLWGLEQGAAGYALLNACRALRYQRDETLTSKLAGGEWALVQKRGPSRSIRSALEVQRGERDDWTVTAAEANFITDVVQQLQP